MGADAGHAAGGKALHYEHHENWPLTISMRDASRLAGEASLSMRQLGAERIEMPIHPCSDACRLAELEAEIERLREVLTKAIHRAEIGLGLAGMVVAERDDLSAAFELGRQAGLDEAALPPNDQGKGRE